MVIILFRASFLDFETVGLFYWRGGCLSRTFRDEFKDIKSPTDFGVTLDFVWNVVIT